MNIKKRKSLLILAVLYLASELISNGLNGNWSILYMLKESWVGFLGFIIGTFLFFYLDNDID